MKNILLKTILIFILPLNFGFIITKKPISNGVEIKISGILSKYHSKKSTVYKDGQLDNSFTLISNQFNEKDNSYDYYDQYQKFSRAESKCKTLNKIIFKKLNKIEIYSSGNDFMSKDKTKRYVWEENFILNLDFYGKNVYKTRDECPEGSKEGFETEEEESQTSQPHY